MGTQRVKRRSLPPLTEAQTVRFAANPVNQNLFKAHDHMPKEFP
jgi:hypothetical protein